MAYETAKVEAALDILDQSPHCIWWKDTDFRYRLMNQATAKTIGYPSSAISFDGITDHDLPCKASELADEFIQQDKYVIRSRKQISRLCFCEYANGEWIITIGHIYPHYDKEKKIIGISGTAADITHCPVMRTALMLLSDDDKLIGRKMNELQQFSYMLKDTYDDFNLTKRESECLFLLIRGMTMKEIANKLGIGAKGVEKHVEHIKLKMGCYRRSELIEKALHNGAGNIIPKSIIEQKRVEEVG